MMDFELEMTGFTLKLTDFELKITDFVHKNDGNRQHLFRTKDRREPPVEKLERKPQSSSQHKKKLIKYKVRHHISYRSTRSTHLIGQLRPTANDPATNLARSSCIGKTFFRRLAGSVSWHR